MRTGFKDGRTFVLHGDDPAAGVTIRFWASVKRHIGQDAGGFESAVEVMEAGADPELVKRCQEITIARVLESADARERELREENESLRIELDAMAVDLRAVIGRVRRFEVKLEGGRYIVLYGRSKEDALSRLPSELPEPPAYVDMKPRGAVVSVDEVGGEQEDGTMDYGTTATLVADVRKAPGS